MIAGLKMSDDIVSIALVGYLPNFGNNFMMTVFCWMPWCGSEIHMYGMW